MAQPVAYKFNTNPALNLIGPSWSSVWIGMTGDNEPNYSESYNDREWRNGIEPGSYYIIYSDDYNQGVQASQNDALAVGWITSAATSGDLLDLINKLPARSHDTEFGDISSAITWLIGEGKYMLANKDYPAIGYLDKPMVVAYDPTFLGSYPLEGSDLWDLTGYESSAALLQVSASISNLDYIALSSSSYVQIPAGFLTNAISINNTRMTISVWFYVDAVGTTQAIFDISQGQSETTNDHFFKAMVDSAGKITASANLNGSTNETIDLVSSVSANTWYHLCVTLSASGGTTAVKAYLNGSLELTPDISGVSSFSLNGGENPHFLGASQIDGSANSEYLDGRIGSFYVYSEVLTATQVADLYAKTDFY